MSEVSYKNLNERNDVINPENNCFVCGLRFGSAGILYTKKYQCTVCFCFICAECSSHTTENLETCKELRKCTFCFLNTIISQIVQDFKQNLELLAQETTLLELKIEESNRKLISKINKSNLAQERIIAFNASTSKDQADYKSLKSELKSLQTGLFNTIEELEESLKNIESAVSEKNKSKWLLEQDLKRSKETFESDHKLLASLKAQLGSLQDSYTIEMRTLESLNVLNKEKRLQKKLSSKEGKILYSIEEETTKLETIFHENQKIFEEIKKIQGNSKTNSIITFEEVSTNNEEEENIKEILIRIQNQKNQIFHLRSELASHDMQDKVCKCLII
jgi:Mg2+ and Co2+ transporter CorA